MKNIIILFLSLALLILSATVVRLENFHYAANLRMCEQYYDINEDVTLSEWEKCLNESETRTSPLWHIVYAVEDTLGL